MARPKRYLVTIRRDLRAGITILLPIVVTAWAVVWLFQFFDGLLGSYVSPFLPIPLPGLGVGLLLITILLAGALSRSAAGVAGILWLDRRLSRIPLASWVYGTATQITHSTMDGRTGTFKRCVLIPYPREGFWALSFITGPAPDVIRERTHTPDMVAVFLPTTPNPTSGFLLYVSEADTVDPEVSTELGFRLIISAGSVQVPSEGAEGAKRGLREFLERM